MLVPQPSSSQILSMTWLGNGCPGTALGTRSQTSGCSSAGLPGRRNEDVLRPDPNWSWLAHWISERPTLGGPRTPAPAALRAGGRGLPALLNFRPINPKDATNAKQNIRTMKPRDMSNLAATYPIIGKNGTPMIAITSTHRLFWRGAPSRNTQCERSSGTMIDIRIAQQTTPPTATRICRSSAGRRDINQRVETEDFMRRNFLSIKAPVNRPDHEQNKPHEAKVAASLVRRMRGCLPGPEPPFGHSESAGCWDGWNFRVM